jgi:hypothetical protein
MVSNEPFIDNEAFIRRCRIIEAISPFWICEEKSLLVMKEDLSSDTEETEAIDISSSEDY